jgi:hypothetical protein
MNGAAATEEDGNIARPPCYHCGEPYTSGNAGQLRLPSLQRDACLLHVSEHVLHLRGAPILKAITIGCVSAAVGNDCLSDGLSNVAISVILPGRYPRPVPVRGVSRTSCAAVVVAMTTGTVAGQACRREPHSEIARILRADNGFEVWCDETAQE